MANAAYLMLVYFLLSVPDLLKVYHTEDEVADQREDVRLSQMSNEDLRFDYIIIGAGSAGGVIANRLSRDNKVLLLERGGNPTPLSLTPYLWLYLARVDPGSSMRYQTTPQPGYSLQTNGVVTLLQGRVLGGTSNLNQMVYTRGNKRMYDEWVAITGDQSWSYASVLDRYKNFEDYRGAFSPADREIYGVDGELHIEQANLIQPSVNTLFEAVREKNLPIKDLNKDQSAGFQPIDFNSKGGHRWGTYQAFIEPCLYRTNLHISRYSTATKIHLDASKRATGVTFTRHGQTYHATASKEVIVSAGVFESPKLLMLSGIGKADELRAHGIEPLVDLPVGKNLMDQLDVALTMNLNKNITFVPERDFTVMTDLTYKNAGTGPFRNTFGTLGYSSSVENNDDNYPDLQYFVQHQTDPGMNPSEAENILRPDANTIAVFLVRPKSPPGEVTLKSSNPDDLPIINPNYGADPNDIKRLVEGVKFIVDLYENTQAYSAIGARLADENFPVICRAMAYRSDEYWDCVVRHLGESAHHFVGTCSMGSVVDSQLRVLGTSGLRVADASVMPTLPNCNTNAPAMMIGEKLSNLIQPWTPPMIESNRVGTKFRDI